ncbi:MAG: PhoH family protein [Firmicutes bacterium]|nr:PhoH family protein [Bacillota bacterium]MDY2919930.1 PhoH family protein [Lentihominibacter sp.]
MSSSKLREMEVAPEIDRQELFGTMDKNLRRIEESLNVDIIQRDNGLVLKGDRATEAESIIDEMMYVLGKGEKLDDQKIGYITDLKENGVSYKEQTEGSGGRDLICFTHEGKPLKAKTLGQRKYVQAIRDKEIVFGIGPAGTGKTYIAVAMAVNALKNREVKKIILARPAVEAGERLGFLPGDLQEKVDPYLRPLYDALYDVLGRESAVRLKEKETIEVVPLAYMRGRTLDNSFIILDEAQNTTPEQMKMFLTRMGFGSKVVVTGDVTQIDLPRGKRSGLIEAERVLGRVDEIGFCKLKDVDVVRHRLVKKVISAYDDYYKAHPPVEDKK